MKKLFTFLITMVLAYTTYSQCTPTNCLATLPPYGGICDTVLAEGSVNQAYSDFESFHITTACFDAGVISSANAGTPIRIVRIDNFTFSGLPAGCSAAPNQAVFNSPANGCIAVTGVPAQAGLFKVRADFLVDINAYPFSASCAFGAVAQNDNAANYEFSLKILPNPSFTMPVTYCSNGPVQNITINGTTGGTFSGPGITGNTFNPTAAGVGFHTIKYVVSAQQGLAIAPASDSATFTVEVVAPSFIYYVDADNDTYGDSNAPAMLSCSPTAPSDFSSNNLDCDDGNALINPTALEIPGNGIDENCDGIDGVADNDGDGYDNSVDCDDNNAGINPGATEICDGIDNNCDGNIDEGFILYSYYLDADGDGFGSNISITSCLLSPPTGYVTNNSDCNDANAQINPGATEICDGIDNDCNNLVDDGLTIYTYYLDIDFDGYGLLSSTIDTCLTSAPLGYAQVAGDCDDTNPNINPGATEVCDGVDNNCNDEVDEGVINTYYEDADGDGYGNPLISLQDCSAPLGYVDNNEDCDDLSFFINPSVSDIIGNGIDENCDGVDGYLSAHNSSQALGVSIYPNPAENMIYLGGGNIKGKFNVKLYDINGRIIMNQIISVQGVAELNISELMPGYYIIELNNLDSDFQGFDKILIIR